MKYILLIYVVEADYQVHHPDTDAIMDEYWAYDASLKEGGHFLAGEALDLTSTAATIRVRAGELQRSDGPFAETREQLAGFYLVEASGLDEAVRLAAQVPDAKFGSIEVRPVMKFEQPTV